MTESNQTQADLSALIKEVTEACDAAEGDHQDDLAAGWERGERSDLWPGAEMELPVFQVRALLSALSAAKAEIERLRGERDDARDLRDTYGAALKDLQDDDYVRNALTIAVVLAKRFYPEVDFKPFDGLGGLISQIDNMVAGLDKRLSAAKSRAEKTDAACDMIAEEREAWKARAQHAEGRVGALVGALEHAEVFIDGLREDLHSRRATDWFPEAANNAALSMSEDMRRLGNRCADFDARAVLPPLPLKEDQGASVAESGGTASPKSDGQHSAGERS